MTILLFGITKDIVGMSSLKLPVPNAMDLKTVGQLKAHLQKSYPGLSKLNSLAVAVNSSYANEDDLINSYDEIALIPPVSGG
ncbi:MAG: molybdopterin converting factor subunit 1 [Flavobacteriaceae bacterium]